MIPSEVRSPRALYPPCPGRHIPNATLYEYDFSAMSNVGFRKFGYLRATLPVAIQGTGVVGIGSNPVSLR